MSTNKIDMPTNEGNLAIARAVSSDIKLKIRNAVLLSGLPSGTGNTVSDIAGLTWSDVSSYAVEGGEMLATSYLPSLYSKEGEGDSSSPVTALDMEFTYIPTGETEYSAIAVLADMYYQFNAFVPGNDYKVGATVWYMFDNAVTYYKCIRDVSNSTTPMDTTYWMSVSVGTPLYDAAETSSYWTISTDDPVLLYISKLAGAVTVTQGMEIDYKVRLYLDCGATEIKDYVVFDTLGPEFMGSAQLDALAYYAQSLSAIRQVAAERAARG